ncbi:MAG: hypothetical protein ACH254_05025, partial [Candidatus Thiodiazotropha endolucinida]
YIGGLYDEINLLLGRAGVIPKLTPKVRRNPVSPSLRGEGGESYLASDSSYMSSSAPASTATAATEEVIQAELFSNLQQLLNLRRASAGGSNLLTSSLMLTHRLAMFRLSIQVNSWVRSQLSSSRMW